MDGAICWRRGKLPLDTPLRKLTPHSLANINYQNVLRKNWDLLCPPLIRQGL